MTRTFTTKAQAQDLVQTKENFEQGERMTFEVGKCYKHTTGQMIRCLVEMETSFWAPGLIAEDDRGGFICVGMLEDNAENWTEIEQAEWDEMMKSAYIEA